jgi:hypothetical protein
MKDEPKQLSKWWQTPSAQAAIQRAKDQRLERIKKFKLDMAERKAKLAQEVNNWKVVA